MTTGQDHPPVVLVPGMLCDAGLWDDVRGAFGPSTVDVLPTEPSIAGMADQVLDAVRGPFVLVGLSLGAIVGFEVLRTAPERVLGCCAMSTNAGAPTTAQLAAWREADELVARGGFDEAVERILPTMFAAPDPHDAERFVAMAHRVGPGVFRAQLAAQATRIDAHDALTRAGVPALVLHGSADALCPADFHTALATAMRGSERHELAGAGHLLPFDRPAELSALLTGWCDRFSLPSPSSSQEEHHA